MPLVLFNPSGATTPGQSGPGSNGNEGVFRILESSSITGTSPSDCLVSYPGHSLGGVLPLYGGAVGLFYSIPGANWAIEILFYMIDSMLFSGSYHVTSGIAEV